MTSPYGLAVQYGWRSANVGWMSRGQSVPLRRRWPRGLCAKLDVETLSNALALAADMSSGTEQYVYDPGPCDTKDLISGFAARSGVFATELAAYGFYGPRGGLDGEYGFFPRLW